MRSNNNKIFKKCLITAIIVGLVWKFGGSNPGRVKLKTEKLAPLFTFYGLEYDWSAQYQFKVNRRGIMFICIMVLWCAGTLKPGLSLNQLQQI